MGILKRESFFGNIEGDSENLILATLDAFAKDPHPKKLNLCIGGEYFSTAYGVVLPITTSASLFSFPSIQLILISFRLFFF